MRTTFVALLAALALALVAGCEHKRQCWVEFKGQPLFTVDGKLWAFPDETCRGIAKAMAESSESTRTELFGMGASERTQPLPCRCE